MDHKPGTSRELRFMIAAACFVIIIAGMRAAAGILVPFLLAVFIAIIFTPPLFWLQAHRVPKSIAIILIMAVIVAIGFLLGTVVGGSVDEFTNALPGYQERLLSRTNDLIRWLQYRGIQVSEPMIRDYFDLGIAMQLVARTFAGLGSALTNTLLILITVIFILLEASDMPAKIRTASGNPEQSLHHLNRFITSVNRYLVLKTLFSLVTGLLVFCWLWILGIDYAILFGVLAFLLNYVPNIGSIVAAVPGILVALVQAGIGSATLTGIGYLAINTTIGSLTEPRIMGSGLGISPLVVFLSLVFWGWILGPVGMLLSVPLTMIFKIAMESNPGTQWLAIILGNQKSCKSPDGNR